MIPGGYFWTEGPSRYNNQEKMARFEAFQLMYPPEQLDFELALTNENLRKNIGVKPLVVN